MKGRQGNRSQGTKQPANKDKTIYQQLELQSPETQMARHDYKAQSIKARTISALVFSNLTTVDPEIHNISEA